MTVDPHDPLGNPVLDWLDARLPVVTFLRRQYGVYPVPRNLNVFWNFGALALFMLAAMIVTGVLLAMQYMPDTRLAFDSVDRIARDVNHGWLLRSLHATGASMFFAILYVHMGRGLYYGSYKRPRELLWMLGVALFGLLAATAFTGYTLPWGQMSFWGATVITDMVSALPWGQSLAHWLWGGYAVGNPTLTRFYALHCLLPFVICAMVGLHVWALHVAGSNNPLGIEPRGEKDTLPFHPYFTVKDLFGLAVFLLVYAACVFFCPDCFGQPDNYVPADPLATPAHIRPEWYFLPFYAILRSVGGLWFLPANLLGGLALAGSVLVLFAVPWLDTSPVRSARFRPLYRPAFWLLVADLIGLGLCGTSEPQGWRLAAGKVATAYYFAHFLVLLPLIGRFEKPLALPDGIAAAAMPPVQADA